MLLWGDWHMDMPFGRTRLERLAAFIDGALDRAERRRLARHARACVECRRVLDEARALLAREDALVAWCCFLVLIARERRLYFSGHGWNTGGTLCFRRALWRRRPFRDMPASSDSWFIRDNAPFIARVCAAQQYLVVRHGANT